MATGGIPGAAVVDAPKGHMKIFGAKIIAANNVVGGICEPSDQLAHDFPAQKRLSAIRRPENKNILTRTRLQFHGGGIKMLEPCERPV